MGVQAFIVPMVNNLGKQWLGKYPELIMVVYTLRSLKGRLLPDFFL